MPSGARAPASLSLSFGELRRLHTKLCGGVQPGLGECTIRELDRKLGDAWDRTPVTAATCFGFHLLPEDSTPDYVKTGKPACPVVRLKDQESNWRLVWAHWHDRWQVRPPQRKRGCLAEFAGAGWTFYCGVRQAEDAQRFLRAEWRVEPGPQRVDHPQPHWHAHASLEPGGVGHPWYAMAYLEPAADADQGAPGALAPAMPWDRWHLAMGQWVKQGDTVAWRSSPPEPEDLVNWSVAVLLLVQREIPHTLPSLPATT